MIKSLEQLAAATGEPNTTPEHRADWGKFVDFVDKRGMAGHPDLDKNNLGGNLLNRFIKENPGTTLTPDSPLHVQNDMSAMMPEESSVIDGLHSNATKIKFPAGDPKAKKKPYDMGEEMRVNGKNILAYDEKPATEVVRSAAQKTGVDPSLLYSSAFQEGMNVAVAKGGANQASEGYNKLSDQDIEDYPVDGYGLYGLDTFGTAYKGLKKYLPEGFDKRFKTYQTMNDSEKHPQKVTTAAFKTNEDALIAKGAFMRQAQDHVEDYFKTKGVQLDDKAKQYFILAEFNSGPNGVEKVMNEYIASKDKPNFVSKGLTSHKDMHEHISPRIKNMEIAAQLLQQ